MTLARLHPQLDTITMDFYASAVPAYVARGAGEVSWQLPTFLDLLPPKARIMELGCGGGGDAAAMMARGFNVDPTDGTPEMAEKAEQHLGRPVA